MDKTSLGDRMKQYEATTQGLLLRRTPVIIRVDGKAFHTFTRCFKDDNAPDPFSSVMHRLMVNTAQAMLMNIQCSQFAYTQSDEISILLRDWDKHETQQWFGGKLQKMISVSAAQAAAYFNFFLTREIGQLDYVGAVPLFDSRVFQLPMDEVANYFIWRQQDATRNSVQMLGRHYFSHNEMNGKNVSQIQDMLMGVGILPVNWNDLDTWKKRGTCVLPSADPLDSSTNVSVDEEIPIFTKDRCYIENHLISGDEGE